MRILGLFSQDQAALDRFANLWRDDAPGSQEKKIRLRRWPAKAPLVVVATVENGNPPVQWAQAPDGCFAVLDGEIFGVGGGHAYRSSAGGDAAALLALYKSKGVDGIADINACAAFAIFDARRRSLLLFRDRLGHVPIFYSERPEGMYWATDLPSLLQIGIPNTLDLNALDYFMSSGYTPAPWTIVEAIRKVAPAHFVSRGVDTQSQMLRYWSATGKPKLVLTPAEASERLGLLVEQAIRRRYTPGSRTSVLLSSGVDSALVAGCLAHRVKAEIEAFTFRYSAYEGQYNEFAMAREIAEYFGIPHHALDYGPLEVVDNFEHKIRAYGEPFLWGIHSSELGDVAATGMETLFTGIAPDGWYLSPVEDKMMLFRRFPLLQTAAAAAVPVLSVLRPKLARDAQVFLSWCHADIPNFAIMPVMRNVHRQKVYTDPTLVDSGRRAAADLIEGMRREVAVESERDQFMLLRQRLFFAESLLLWNHAWARAHDLALRHPYTDNDVQEFVWRLHRRDTNKKDLRRFAATVLPRDKAYAAKIYQTLPLDQWFRGPLRAFVREQLSASRLARQGLFKPHEVLRLIEEHEQGKVAHTWRLLALLTVTVWQDSVAKGGGVAG